MTSEIAGTENEKLRALKALPIGSIVACAEEIFLKIAGPDRTTQWRNMRGDFPVQHREVIRRCIHLHVLREGLI